MPRCGRDQLRVRKGVRRERQDEVSDQRIQATSGHVTAVALCLLILGSVDWVAWLALQSSGSDARAAIVGCLSTLALALVRACVVLVREIGKERPPAKMPGKVLEQDSDAG